MREALRVLIHRPSPLAVTDAMRPTGDASLPFPGIVFHRLDRTTSGRLRAVATADDASLNDLLLCELFATIHRWNQRHGSPADRQWLRITMPTNLRVREDNAMPAANVMGYAFLTRRGADSLDRRALLRSIRDETRAIRGGRLAAHFLKTIGMIGRLPGGMRWAMPGRRCFSTAVLTNVGDPTRRFHAELPRRDGKIVVGDMVLERVSGVAPLRPGTRLAVSLSKYRGCLEFSLRCDPREMSAAASQEFMDAYIARLNEILDA
jgi:hypothetical protein